MAAPDPTPATLAPLPTLTGLDAAADARFAPGLDTGFSASPRLAVWKGRGWELGCMVAAAGLLVYLAG